MLSVSSIEVASDESSELYIVLQITWDFEVDLSYRIQVIKPMDIPEKSHVDYVDVV